MNYTECSNCKKELKETASFCSGCGSQVRCTSCKEIISAGGNFCEGCGAKVGRQKENSEATNTFEFSENAEGRSVKAAFTDSAVKDMAQTMASFVSSKQIALGTNEQRNVNQNSGMIDIEVEEAELVNNVIFEEKQKPSQTTINSDIPDLKNLVYRRLPNSESEWMLIYACYSTNFKLEPVTLDKIKEYYVSSGRKTESNQKNLKSNLGSLIKGLFIEYINDNEFVVTDNGFAHAREILARTSSSESTNKGGRPISKAKKGTGESSGKSQKNKSNGKVVAKNVSQEEFDIAVKGKTLEQFYKENSSDTSTNHRILLIAYYILKYAKQSSFSDGNIDYAYRVLQLNNRPAHLRQTIVNMKNRQVWITDGASTGSWVLSRNGEIYVEEKLLKTKK